MKCPNCGKKMKKTTCAKCGYDSTAQVEVPETAPVVTETPATPVVTATPTYGPKVNYFTYNPANPNVWYPVTTSTQSQPTMAQPTYMSAPMQVQSSNITFATAPMAQSVAQPAVPVQQAQPTATTSAEATVEKVGEADELATRISKKAEKAAKKLAKKAEKKMTKSQKKAVKTALDVVDKIEEKVPSNVASRLFAIVLVALCALTFGVFDIYAIVDPSQVQTGIVEGNMLSVFMNALKADDKLFGVLPAFFSNGNGSTAYNLSVYIFTLCGLIAVLYAVFAVFSKENAPKRVRRSMFFLGAGALDYTVSLSAAFGKGENALLSAELFESLNLLNLGGYQVELLPAAIGGACLVLSFLFLIFRRKVKTQEAETENEKALSC